MSRAYDSFDVQLSSLQFLYSKPGTHADGRRHTHANSRMETHTIIGKFAAQIVM